LSPKPPILDTMTLLIFCQGTSTRRQQSNLFSFKSQAAACYYQSNHSNVEAILLSTLPKNTTSELASLFFTLPL